MHSLQVIKTACVDALDDERPASLRSFHAVVDPGSVLEMAHIIETLLERLDQTGMDPALVEQVNIHLGAGWTGPVSGNE